MKTLVVSQYPVSWSKIARSLSTFLGSDYIRLTTENTSIDKEYDKIVYIGGIHTEKQRLFLRHLSRRSKKMILWVDESYFPHEPYTLDDYITNYLLVPVSEWNKEVYSRYAKNISNIVPRGTDLTRSNATRHNYIVSVITGGLHKASADITLAFEMFAKDHDTNLMILGGSLGSNSKNIRTLDFLGEEEYISTLSHAKFIVNLGFEAFSIPSIEAWALGVPSLYTSLPDISNHSRGMKIEPLDIDCINMGETDICYPIYDEYEIVEVMNKMLTTDYQVDELDSKYKSSVVNSQIMKLLYEF